MNPSPSCPASLPFITSPPPTLHHHTSPNPQHFTTSPPPTLHHLTSPNTDQRVYTHPTTRELNHSPGEGIHCSSLAPCPLSLALTLPLSSLQQGTHMPTAHATPSCCCVTSVPSCHHAHTTLPTVCVSQAWTLYVCVCVCVCVCVRVRVGFSIEFWGVGCVFDSSVFDLCVCLKVHHYVITDNNVT